MQQRIEDLAVNELRELQHQFGVKDYESRESLRLKLKNMLDLDPLEFVYLHETIKQTNTAADSSSSKRLWNVAYLITPILVYFIVSMAQTMQTITTNGLQVVSSHKTVTVVEWAKVENGLIQSVVRFWTVGLLGIAFAALLISILDIGVSYILSIQARKKQRIRVLLMLLMEEIHPSIRASATLASTSE